VDRFQRKYEMFLLLSLNTLYKDTIIKRLFFFYLVTVKVRHIESNVLFVFVLFNISNIAIKNKK